MDYESKIIQLTPYLPEMHDLPPEHLLTDEQKDYIDGYYKQLDDYRNGVRADIRWQADP